MSSKTFKSPCERLRFRALRDGEGSDADKLWRKHAATCKECQTSLHIMKLLQGDAPSEEHQLSKVKIEQLMQMVNDHYGDGCKHRHHRGLAMLWRVSLVASVVFVAGHFLPLERLLEKSVGSVAETVVLQGARKSPAVTGHSSKVTAIPASTEENSEFSDMMPMNQMDQSIEHIRAQIDNQFNELNDLIDRDLNEY